MINPFKKLYYKIKFSIEAKNFEKDYISEYETQSLKHIWGIKSGDDLSGKDCNLYTMNDFDITYHKDTNDYTFGIETIYSFNTDDGEKEYLQNVLNAFTEWMKNSGYNVNRKFLLHDVFNGNNIVAHFKSIEECYANFKMLVKGYCSL